MAGTEEGEGVGFIDPGVIKAADFAEGDIFVSTPPRSGTHWTMYLVYQLVQQGREEHFDSLYHVVPWLDMRLHRRETIAERLRRLRLDEPRAAGELPRVYKTHFPPAGPVPYKAGVRYVVVVRQPEDAFVSLVRFWQEHHPDFFRYWGMEEVLSTPDPYLFTLPFFDKLYFSFLRAMDGQQLWLKPNVLLVHYQNLVDDLPGQIRRMASFLALPLSDELLQRIVARSTFEAMKSRATVFEPQEGVIAPDGFSCPFLNPGAVFHRGFRTSSHPHSGFTAAHSAALHQMAAQQNFSAPFWHWVQNGGEFGS